MFWHGNSWHRAEDFGSATTSAAIRSTRDIPRASVAMLAQTALRVRSQTRSRDTAVAVQRPRNAHTTRALPLAPRHSTLRPCLYQGLCMPRRGGPPDGVGRLGAPTIPRRRRDARQRPGKRSGCVEPYNHGGARRRGRASIRVTPGQCARRSGSAPWVRGRRELRRTYGRQRLWRVHIIWTAVSASRCGSGFPFLAKPRTISASLRRAASIAPARALTLGANRSQASSKALPRALTSSLVAARAVSPARRRLPASRNSLDQL